MRSLYITHVGMIEPLGQSQVMPYLVGLARRGADIEILSYEMAGTPADAIDALRGRFDRERIRWSPTFRSPAHGLGRKVLESAMGAARGLALALARRPDIVHARSYLPAAVADVIATTVPRAKLLFDCRGMIGDEYVDGGHWTRDRLEYRLVKAYERRLFRRADGIVVLTRALERWLRDQAVLGAHSEMAVIPCCADLEKFRPDPEVRAASRAAVGVAADELLVVYSGSLGNWYLAEEMVRFFAAVRARRPRARWLVLTPSDTSDLEAHAARAGVPRESLVFRRAPPAEMPSLLAAGDIGLSFIQSCFSKTGSSPTKVAEYLASGLPAVLNGDIGDQRDLASERECAVVLRSYSTEDLATAAEHAILLAERPHAERAAAAVAGATRHFSLEDIGVPRYEAIYRALAGSAARDGARGGRGTTGATNGAGLAGGSRMTVSEV